MRHLLQCLATAVVLWVDSGSTSADPASPAVSLIYEAQKKLRSFYKDSQLTPEEQAELDRYYDVEAICAAVYTDKCRENSKEKQAAIRAEILKLLAKMRAHIDIDFVIIGERRRGANITVSGEAHLQGSERERRQILEWWIKCEATCRFINFVVSGIGGLQQALKWRFSQPQ